MDRRDHGPHMLVGERKQPSDTLAPLELEAERLDEDHVGEVLCDQCSAGLGLDQFVSHAVERPA